jgi:nucleoside-diphosphate-sugar epimerase
MIAFVTGATGFVGSRLVEKLRGRGDDVVCLVRNPAKARDLEAAGCRIVEGDLSDQAKLRAAMEGCDAVFHLAADYRVGVRTSEHPKLQDANIGGTTRVIDAAVEAGAKKIVYVSTIAAFGNTRGEIVDEAHEHPGGSYTSEYERTKVEAHRIANDRIAKGAPVVIVQPGGIYGPGDHSAIGSQIDQAATGKLPALAFPELGLNMVHVDDVADGIIAAHDKGAPGEAYVLGGELTTLGDVVRKAAEVGGRKPPRLTMPTVLLKAMVPVAPLVTKAMGVGPNLRELITASDGVTYWATDAKAREQLGYAPRDLDTGLRQTLAASSASSASTSASA